MVEEKKEEIKTEQKSEVALPKKEEKKPETALPKKEEKKPETALPKKETKVFTIPLRKAFRKTKNKRTDYAAYIVKDFLQRHTKSEEVKLGKNLAEKLHSMPRRVRVSVFKDDKTIKAELMGFTYKEFKTLPKKERLGMKEKLMGRLGPKAAKKQQEEERVKEQKKPEAPKKEEKHVMIEE